VTVAVSDVTSRLKAVTFPETTGGGAVYPQEGVQTATVSHAYAFTSGSTFSGSGAVTVSDRAGNVAGVPLTVTRDVASPTAVLTVAKRSSSVTLTVAWGGEDGTGAGVATYDVQVREDEGGWTDWLTGTGQTQGEYVGQYGHRYGFRVRATDQVSNTGDWVEGTSFLAWVTKYYAFNGQRVAMREGDVVYYLHGDHLGSTSVASSDSGVLHSRQGYTPYGEVRYVTGELPTEFGFTGQRSEDFGLYDYHARFYDPSLGRFISADTIVPEPAEPQDLNRYAYVRNNPLKYVDPSGHVPGWDPGAAGDLTDEQLADILMLRYGDQGVPWEQIPYEHQETILEGDRTQQAYSELLTGGVENVAGTIHDPVVWVTALVGAWKLAPTFYAAGEEVLLQLSVRCVANPTCGAIVFGAGAGEKIDPGKIGRPGSSENIKEVIGGSEDALALFHQLVEGATINPHSNPDVASAGGLLAKLSNGSTIGFRPFSKSGPPTIDIHNFPGLPRVFKIKFVVE